MAKAKKAKKYSKGKSKKQAQSDRLFNFVLLGIGALLLVGVVFSLVVRGGGATTAASSGNNVQSELYNGALGKKITELGFKSPTYDPSKSQEFMVVANPQFLQLTPAEQTKRMNEIGNDWAKLLKKRLGDAKLAYIMFHSDQNHMMATWTPQSGVQSFGR